MSPDEQLQAAEVFARNVLGDRAAKLGDKIIDHTERVVALCWSVSTKTVAWLHDVVEDTDTTLDDLRAAGFKPWVIAAVDALTKRPEESGKERYATYIHRLILSLQAQALIVKRADLVDHLRPNCPPYMRERYENALREVDDVIEFRLESYFAMSESRKP